MPNDPLAQIATLERSAARQASQETSAWPLPYLRCVLRSAPVQAARQRIQDAATRGEVRPVRLACLAWLRCLRAQRMLGVLAVLSGVLLLPGCADFASMAETLNARQIQSCVYVQGGYGLFAGARMITATGGVPLETCLREGR